MRKIFWAAVALIGAAPALGHNFWVQPVRFVMNAPGPAALLIYIGHGPERERWGVAIDRVVQFRTIGPDGRIDRMANLTLDSPRYDAIVTLAQPGAYVFGFQSKPAASTLPQSRFNQYLSEEGLTPIQADRRRKRTELADGHELYSRRAKAIVQIGPIDAASIARVTRPIGLSLEIVPERHPNALKPAERLPVLVLYQGKPLAGALVKLTNLDADNAPLTTLRTDRAGRGVFTVPRTGSWKLSVVWADATRGGPAAPYRTTFSSLAFGY